jgi:galactokinase/mevalonate kinase-like predicted kinase
VVFNNPVTISTKNQENPHMVNLGNSRSILNRKKILELKVNLKQSWRTKRELSSIITNSKEKDN